MVVVIVPVDVTGCSCVRDVLWLAVRTALSDGAWLNVALGEIEDSWDIVPEVEDDAG